MRINTISNTIPMAVRNSKQNKSGLTNKTNSQNPNFGFKIEIDTPTQKIKNAITTATKQKCTDNIDSFIGKVHKSFDPYSLDNYKNETLVLSDFEGEIKPYTGPYDDKSYISQGVLKFHGFDANKNNRDNISEFSIPLQLFYFDEPYNDNNMFVKCEKMHKICYHRNLAFSFIDISNMNISDSFNEFIDYGMNNEKGNVPTETKMWAWEWFGMPDNWSKRKYNYKLFVNYLNHEGEPKETRELLWKAFERRLSAQEALMHYRELGEMKPELLAGQTFDLLEFADNYENRFRYK